MFEITRTPEQKELLATPWTFSLDALMAADFVGDQLYIDWWISKWLNTNDISGLHLPLCVEESIHCDKKLMNLYQQNLKLAIIHGRTAYLRKHFIVDRAFWNIVEFSTVKSKVFDILWKRSPAPLSLLPFVVQARRLALLSSFVNYYDPTKCLRECVIQQWSEGVRICLAEGAEIQEDCIGLAVRHAGIFRQLTELNPRTTVAHWKEFRLQRMLKRVPDVPLVEEWFWINGFKNN